MNTYELLGRKTEQLETLQQEYMNLLQLVVRIKLGEVAIGDVEIIEPNGWRIAPRVSAVQPAAELAAEPAATTN